MKKLLKIFLITLVLIPLSGYLILKYVAEPVQMMDDGMSPTIEKGQYAWFDHISIKFSALQRGDIVVYTDPNAVDEGYFYQQLIGRIVGVPGDIVQLKEGMLFVDGVELDENYAEKGAHPNTLRSGFLETETRLTGDHYVVLADNRVGGKDSKLLGPVPKHCVKGKVFIWY